MPFATQEILPRKDSARHRGTISSCQIFLSSSIIQLQLSASPAHVFPVTCEHIATRKVQRRSSIAGSFENITSTKFTCIFLNNETVNRATVASADLNILAAFFDTNTIAKFLDHFIQDLVVLPNTATVPVFVISADMFKIQINVLHCWLLVINYTAIIHGLIKWST